jgi:hypothetical protein
MDVLVRQVVHHLQQFGIFAEEVFACVTAWLDGILLIVAVDRLFHSLEQ